MRAITLTREQFKQHPQEQIMLVSGNDKDLYTTLFSSFRLTPEEWEHQKKINGLDFSKKDENGKFSNLFILDFLWQDSTKTANNTELIIFFQGEFRSCFVE